MKIRAMIALAPKAIINQKFNLSFKYLIASSKTINSMKSIPKMESGKLKKMTTQIKIESKDR